MKKILDLKTVHECNRNLGCKTWHPQVSIINLENPNLEQEAVKFEFYAILLIEECPDGCCCCGRITTIPMPQWYSSLPAKYFA